MASKAAKQEGGAKKTSSSKNSSKSGGSRKAAASKSSGGRSRTAAAASRQIPEETEQFGAGLAKEAVMWLILALCVFLFISYFGFGGYLGGMVSDVSFGVFGLAAYLFPVLVFISVAFLVSNRGSRLAAVKFLSAVVLYVALCGFLGLIQGDNGEKLSQLYKNSAAHKSGGGVVGGGICHLLAPAMGTVGTGVILAILAIICLVLITQRSIMKGMEKQSRKMVESAREASVRRRESRQQELERRREEQYLEIPEAPKDQGLHLERELVSPAAGKRPGRRSFDNRKASRTKEPGNNRDRYGIPAHPGAMGEREFLTDSPGAMGERELLTDFPGAMGKGELLADSPGAMGDGELLADYPTGGTQFAGRSAASGKRTEIQVPVLFPADSREIRKRRKVKGVTLDTKLTADPALAPAEIHEIRPRRPAPEHTMEERDTMYLDLDRQQTIRPIPDQAEEPRPVSLDEEIRPDELMIHIEGISSEDPSAPDDAPAEESGKRTLQAIDFSDDPIPEENAEEEERSAGRRTRGHGPTVPEDQEESLPWYEGEEDSEESEVSPAPVRRPRSAAGRTRTIRTGAGEDASESQETASRADQEQESSKDQEPKSALGGGIKKNPRSSQQEIEEGIASVAAEAAKTAETVKQEYIFPPLSLLKKGKSGSGAGQEQEVRRTAAKLQQTLNSFGVHVTVTNVSCGPSVTRYELLPEQGVKVSRIVSLSDDIKLNLAASDIRIEAPIPGKSAVGIEVPNSENSTVALRDLLESDEFKSHKSKLAFAAGKDIGGKPVVTDIAKMPHLLIAGATGSGKSVCINTLIMSILYKASPEEVKLIMIDPKVVELSVYNGIPHLYIPVVTDPKKAAGALNWGVAEMTDRYNKFAEVGVRDLKGYNQKIEALKDVEDESKPKKLPQIVIIVDELADLMMVAPGEVEDSICRLAQLARAAGIHLIIATQRPSVNVITGLIKANMPSRIAFSVSSGVDSRTIIDMNGAEKLLGKGDMLFYPQGYQKPARVQGAFVSDEEVSDVVDFLKNKNTDAGYSAEMEEQIAKLQQASAAARGAEDVDELFAEAGKFIIEKDKASIGMLQRVFKIGFNRAARIMDQLSEAGVVGPEEGTKPRKILMSEEQFENYLEQN